MNKSQTPSGDRIDLMQTFVRIVETGSLSAAARQLGTTQPTVSRRLQALEASLGLHLLQRSTHRMKLTEDGERYFVGTRELLERWNQLEAELRGIGDEPEGRLRVVVPHAFGQHQLVGPLEDYLRRYPRVNVEWLLHDRCPDFIAEAVDCAIHVGEVKDPTLVAVRLYEVPRIVVIAPAVLDGAAVPEHAQALAALPWLAMRTYYRTEVALHHRASGAVERFPIQPRISTDSLYALRDAALRGLGAAIVSSWLVQEDLARGALVHLAPDWEGAPLPVSLIYPHARHYPARLRRFIEIIKGSMPGAVLP